MVHWAFRVCRSLLTGAVNCRLPSLIGLSVASCSQHGASDQQRAENTGVCHKDTDCAQGQRCELSGQIESTLAMVKPPTCYETQCTAENVATLCAEGQVCVPVEQARRIDLRFVDPQICASITQVCGTPCDEDADCTEGQRCRDNGQCELSPCDEPGALVCPPTTHCDPAVALGTPSANLPGVPYNNSLAIGLTRGCAVTRCSEEGGVVCQDLWRCNSAIDEDSGGCEPVPCQETDKCSSDLMICSPTSTQSRSGAVDAHGCVERNCEEGLACTYLIQQQNVGYCDFNGPFAQLSGCAALPCDQGDGLCPGTLICDRNSVQADERGCRPPRCTEGALCSSQATCEPNHPNADNSGCVTLATSAETPVTSPSTSNTNVSPNVTAAAETTAEASNSGVVVTTAAETTLSNDSSGSPPPSALGMCVDAT